MFDSALTVLFLSAKELLRRTSITASWIFKVDLIIQVLIEQLTDYSYKDTPASKLFFLSKILTPTVAPHLLFSICDNCTSSLFKRQKIPAF